MRSIRNCDNNNHQVIKISANSSTIINDKCEVFSYTCADVKAYNQATVSKSLPIILENSWYIEIKIPGCSNDEEKRYGYF